MIYDPATDHAYISPQGRSDCCHTHIALATHFGLPAERWHDARIRIVRHVRTLTTGVLDEATNPARLRPGDIVFCPEAASLAEIRTVTARNIDQDELAKADITVAPWPTVPQMVAYVYQSLFGPHAAVSAAQLPSPAHTVRWQTEPRWS